MSVDHLPANTTATASAPVVIDAADVHRDWRHIGAETAGITAAVTAAGSLTLSTFNALPTLMWALTFGCATNVVALIVLLTLMRREGRRWTCAITDEPYHGDPAATR